MNITAFETFGPGLRFIARDIDRLTGHQDAESVPLAILIRRVLTLSEKYLQNRL